MSANFVIESIVLVLALLLLFLSNRFFSWRSRMTSEPDAARLLDAQLFSLAIIDTLPVGIAVFSPADGAVLAENALAIRMLGGEDVALRLSIYRHIAIQFVKDDVDDHLVEGMHSPFMDVPSIVQMDRKAELGAVFARTRFSGRAVILIGLVDITERKKNESLLLQARNAAIEANQAKSNFIAVMSHEIRTPLHGVVGNLELLARTGLNVEQKEHVDLIQVAFEGLVEVVSDILDVTSIESNALRLNIHPVSLNTVIERCAQSFSAAALQKGLDFRCDTDPILDAPLSIDAARVTQILRNLLSNSVKFTETGFISISSQWVDIADGRGCIRISVEDSGIGITQEHRSSLFRPLAYSRTAINNRFRNTGLGLFISDSLASLMGGTIALTSEVGVGTTLSVELPIETPLLENKPAQFLNGIIIDVLCDEEKWRANLILRLSMWGATIDPTQGKNEQIPHILVCARQGSIFIPIALSTSASLGAIIATPGGTREPRREGRNIYISSLSSASLAMALRMVLSEPEPSPASTVYADSAPLSATRGAPVEFSPIKDILIAEDEPVAQQLIVQQLKALGYRQIRVAKTGAEALEMWRERPPDLTLTDLSMPVAGGVELLAEIRKLRPDSRVIAMTASFLGEQEKIIAGFSAVMRKPILIADLLQAIRNEAVSFPAHISNNTDAVRSEEEFATLAHMNSSLGKIYARSWGTERIAIENALSSRDRNLLQRKLHRMRGALLAIGDDKRATRVASLERKCKKMTWNGLAVNATIFLDEMDQWAISER